MAKKASPIMTAQGFDLAALVQNSVAKIRHVKVKEVGIFSNINSNNGAQFGSLMLDVLLNGGIPDGRFGYVYGPERSGKTSISNMLMGNANASGRAVIHIDSERAADGVYMEKCGIKIHDSNSYQYVETASGESAFKAIHMILDNWPEVTDDMSEEQKQMIPRAPVVIIDSIASLAPEMLLDDVEKSPIALLARMLSTWFRVIKGDIGRKNGVLFAINQMRMNPMQMFGSPETEPGGQAVLFFPDVKIRISRSAANTKKIADGDEFGRNCQSSIVKTIKCKHTSPGRMIEDFRIELGVGLDYIWDTLQYLLYTKQATKRGDKVHLMIEGKDQGNYSYVDLGQKLDKDGEIQKFCRKQLNSGKFLKYIKDDENEIKTDKYGAVEDDVVDDTIGEEPMENTKKKLKKDKQIDID